MSKAARLGSIIVAGSLLGALWPATAGAALIQVSPGMFTDVAANDTFCSIREAVTAANANAADTTECTDGESGNTDLIALQPGTYTLTGAAFDDGNVSGDLDVNLNSGPVEIEGAGAGATTIDPNDNDRAVHGLGTGTLTVSDLRLDDGTITGSNAGGGINGSNANVNLVLAGVRVSFSSSANSSGGGIFSPGPLTLTSSEVDNNTAFSQMSTAGAAAIQANGTVMITDSTIHDNTVTTPPDGTNDGTNIEGGAIFTGGPLTMSRSTVRDNSIVSSNTTRFPEGAGIRLLNGNATITDSTISGNSTTGGNNPSGGGISFADNSGGPDKVLTVQNTTISGNAPGSPALGSTFGGGIDIFGGTVTITNSTFTLNQADNGEDIDWSEPGGQNSAVTLRGSIFNEDGVDECREVAVAEFTTAGHNVDRGTSCDLDSSVSGTDLESQTSGAIGLGAMLASNGGPTMTHTISSTSVARDTIPQVDCDEADLDPLTADQRGAPRPDYPSGTNCDSGAYEYTECVGQVVNIVGTGAAETLIGTGNADGILGLDGADDIQAGNGSDRVCAGNGDDTLLETADMANDQFLGEAGADTLSLDTVVPSNYMVTVGSGTGSVSTPGLGTDLSNSVENAIGSGGGDTLTGDGGVNDLKGGAGMDTITGGGGMDMLFGESEADNLFARDGVMDTVDCGAATDVLQTDVQGTDTIANCETIDFLAPPVVTPTPTPIPTTSTPAPTTARKKCKKKKKRSAAAAKKCKKKKR